MAQRFYFPSAGTAPVSPAFSSDWERTNQAAVLPLVRTKSSTAMSTQGIGEPASAENDCLAFQFVSEPLPEAVTISGTLKAQMRALESATGANARAQLIVRVVSNDGLTVRGTLIAADVSANSNEFSAISLTNRKFPKAWAGAGAAISSLACNAGDRIVVELGARFGAVIGGGGYTASFRHGDTGGTDLPEDESTTADNVPWIEFSQTLYVAKAFVTAAGTVTAEGGGPDVVNRVLLGVPALTNLTARQRTCHVRRGRSDNLSRIEAGTSEVLFKNGEGAPLDPGNLDSPYFPYVRAGAELQVDRRKALVLYPRFRGRVERFLPSWLPPSYQEQKAVASDAFEGWSSFTIQSNAATLTTALAGSNNDLTFTAKEEGGRGDDITIAYVVAGTGTSLGGGTNDPLDGEAFIESPAAADATTSGLGGLGILLGGSQAVVAPTTFEVRGSEITINVATDGGGAATSTANSIKAFVEATPELSALVSVELAPGNSGAGVVTAMAATALSGGKWPQEKSGARINRVLDVMGWPALLRRIDPGLCEVVAQGFAKRDKVSGLSHMQDVAESELGYFFVSNDGYAVYHAGDHRGTATRSTVSQATFADAQAGAGFFYSTITPEYSKDKVFNRISVTAGYQGAEPQVVEDLESQLTYSPVSGVPLPRDLVKSTLLASDVDALAVATTLLAAFKDAKVRFEQISLKERADTPGWIEAVQGREIGDLVTLRTKPPGHSSVGVYECYIEEIADDVAPGLPVQITFTLSLATEALDIPPVGGALKDSTGDDFILDSGTAGVLG